MWWATYTVLLWLLVINLGIAVGAGLYEHRITLPRWISTAPGRGRHWNAEAAGQDDVGRKFWAFVTTMPLTFLALANLVAAWSVSGSVRGWWLAAAIAALADRVFTFSFFIPRMIGLMRAADSPESVATAVRWRRWNYVRLAIIVAAWLAALNAFSLRYQGYQPKAYLKLIFPDQ